MDHPEHTLWELQTTGHRTYCVMRSCCSGAELQIRRLDAPTGPSASAEKRGESHPEQAVTLVRELYPTKSDLYERARALAVEYQHSSERSESC